MISRYIFLNILCFFLAQTAYATTGHTLRDGVIEETMYALEKKVQKNNFMRQKDRSMIWSLSKDAYMTLGLELGYLKGNVAYDFNHHTSELEFPMDNLLAGGDFSFGYKDLSLNAQLWFEVEDYAGFKMKDRDWDSQGTLISYTKSKAYLDAFIWEANLRYNFYKKTAPGDENAPSWSDDNRSLLDKLKWDTVRVGALLGYKYERLDFDMYDLWDQLLNTTTRQGVKVLDYSIKYWLPYLGVAVDISRQNWGFGFNIKYSFYPIARDIDHHFLRDLTFYGDYEKKGNAWMGGINGFWEFVEDWKLKLGVDGTLIRIDGVTWDSTHNPAWDADQSTDTKYWISWIGVEYKF